MLIVTKDSQDAMRQPTFNKLVAIPKLSHLSQTFHCTDSCTAHPFLVNKRMASQQFTAHVPDCSSVKTGLSHPKPLLLFLSALLIPQKEARPANLPACRVILIYRLVLSKSTQPHVVEVISPHQDVCIYLRCSDQCIHMHALQPNKITSCPKQP